MLFEYIRSFFHISGAIFNFMLVVIHFTKPKGVLQEYRHFILVTAVLDGVSAVFMELLHPIFLAKDGYAMVILNGIMANHPSAQYLYYMGLLEIGCIVFHVLNSFVYRYNCIQDKSRISRRVFICGMLFEFLICLQLVVSVHFAAGPGQELPILDDVAKRNLNRTRVYGFLICGMTPSTANGVCSLLGYEFLLLSVISSAVLGWSTIGMMRTVKKKALSAFTRKLHRMLFLCLLTHISLTVFFYCLPVGLVLVSASFGISIECPLASVSIVLFAMLPLMHGALVPIFILEYRRGFSIFYPPFIKKPVVRAELISDKHSSLQSNSGYYSSANKY